MSAKGDAEFYEDDEIERYSEEFLFENGELVGDFTKTPNAANRPVTSNSPSSARKITTIGSLITIFSTSPWN